MEVVERADTAAMKATTRVVVCESWEDFKTKIRDSYAEALYGRYPVFRGHARAEWKLASHWERKLAVLQGNNRDPKLLRDREHHLEKFLQGILQSDCPASAAEKWMISTGGRWADTMGL